MPRGIAGERYVVSQPTDAVRGCNPSRRPSKAGGDWVVGPHAAITAQRRWHCARRACGDSTLLQYKDILCRSVAPPLALALAPRPLPLLYGSSGQQAMRSASPLEIITKRATVCGLAVLYPVPSGESQRGCTARSPRYRLPYCYVVQTNGKRDLITLGCVRFH